MDGRESQLKHNSSFSFKNKPFTFPNRNQWQPFLSKKVYNIGISYMNEKSVYLYFVGYILSVVSVIYPNSASMPSLKGHKI